MKHSRILPCSFSATLAVLCLGLLLSAGLCRAQGAEDDDGMDQQGAQVLTRGPVHEAFAGVVSFKPEPGAVVPEAPPEIIQEIPPDQKPEGDNVTWIPGYWAWDDEKNDFLWVSGVWRALPPGRQWIAGYWTRTGGGYQWISGYWADADETQITYLPSPPTSLESGPNVAAPADDYVWIPGCWIWMDGRYAWKPGNWIEGQTDWVWSPDYYVWTPRGYVFVDGYWDYSIERRGVLFAPVYFDAGVRSETGYSYTPSVVIDLSVLPNHLFLRPRYSHYYFGDYYDAQYSNDGFIVSFSFETDGYGYDPIYAHRRWQHRQDPNWEHHIEGKYQDRRDHKNTRPPRTWVAQKNATRRPGSVNAENPPVAASFADLSKQASSPRQFQPLATDQKHQFMQRSQEVRQSRDSRRSLEATSVNPAAPKPGEAFQPSVAQRPRSPIFSKSSATPRPREQAPPRPLRPRGL